MRKSHKVRVVAVILAMALLPVSVSATPTKEEIKKENQDKLNETNQQIKDLNKLKQEIEKDLKAAAEDMEKLMNEQAALQKQIDGLLEDRKESEEKLEEIRQTKEKNYEAMKVRIQYMYENGTDIDIWNSVASATSIGDMLSQLEYVKVVYENDRLRLDEYEKAIEEEARVQEQLNTQMEALVKASEEFAGKQEELGVYIASLETKSNTYKGQIDRAKALAESYEQVIASIDNPVVPETGSSASFEGTIGGPNPIPIEQANLDKSVAYLFDSKYNPPKSTSISQVELIQYALKFVGCHYVWGGNTMGCKNWHDGLGVDCSGFVHEVYKHFGIDTVRYSQSFKNVGKPVAYVNIQPGDIVVYPGHVALYVGDGKIVEAQSSKTGVTAYRSLSRTSSRITAIRRLL